MNTGGVACIRNASVAVNNCTFSHNIAEDSGGVLNVENSTIIINSSSFHNNSAGIDGGVLYTYLLSSTIVLLECSFTNNRAGDDGGVIYIGKTRSILGINRSSFSHNVANDRGGTIIVFNSTVNIYKTNMQNNRASSGDDVALCTQSSLNPAPYYFNDFQLQTTSMECTLYGRFARKFTLPVPEDHSNISLTNYYRPDILNPYHHNDDPLAPEVPGITTTWEHLLNNLQAKLSKTSAVLYALLSFTLLFNAILVVIIVIMFCLRKRKKRATKDENLSSNNIIDKHNTSESTDLYEEPVWKNDKSDAIKMETNAGYAQHVF